MFGIYQTTDQGKQTRSHLLTILEQQDGLTRQELVAAGLTYDQVRRQTENLIFERQIYSCKDVTGRRRYYLQQKIIQNLSKISLSCIVLVLSWSLPINVSYTIGTDEDDPIEKNPTELVVGSRCHPSCDRTSLAA